MVRRPWPLCILIWWLIWIPWVVAVQDVSFTAYNRRLMGVATGERSGFSVSRAGDVNKDGIGDIIVGSYLANPYNRAGAGVSYVIFGSRNYNALSDVDLSSIGNGTAFGFRIVGAAAGDNSGYSVSDAGDFNNDGYDDLIIGAPLADPNTKSNAGAAYIIFGSANPVSVDLLTMISGVNTGIRIQGAAIDDNCGWSVSSAGDVNGDGRKDVVIGAPLADPGSRSAAGTVYILFGHDTNTVFVDINFASMFSSVSVGFRINGWTAGDSTGFSVSAAGDFNKDGYGDILMSAHLGSSGQGGAFIVYGHSNSGGFSDLEISSTGSGNAVGFYMIGGAANEKTGSSVSGAGDINGDGYADIIIGAPLGDPAVRSANSDAGISYVVFGRAALGNIPLTGLPSINGFRILGATVGDNSGYSVGSAGDFNSDGYADVIVGAPIYSPSSAGASYIIYGHSTLTSFPNLDLLSLSSGVRFASSSASMFSGWSVSGAGDVNGDGGSDIIIGAYGAAVTGRGTPGASYVFHGIASPTSQPSSSPSSQPSRQPSRQPTSQPTRQPSSQPTSQPSRQPSSVPTTQPSRQPTSQPTRQPSSTPTSQPSSQPSMQPSAQPNAAPTSQPSRQPSSRPTNQPSGRPSSQPSSQPSARPSNQPSAQPSLQPSAQPNAVPTSQPSRQPSSRPTNQPSSHPSGQPSSQPSSRPSAQPSAQPSMQPSAQPNAVPTSKPTRQPSSRPTGQPSGRPTSQPSSQPSARPSGQPSAQPSGQPTAQPSARPSNQPSGQPSSQPSRQPSSQPSLQPSRQPSMQPTTQPSVQPSAQPTAQPSVRPTSQPSQQPSAQPSGLPSRQPSTQPSRQPSIQPTTQPSRQPSAQPSGQPSSHPSVQPSTYPSSQPSVQPSGQPSRQPSGQPSTQPTAQPTEQPSTQPTALPSTQPSTQPSAQPSSQPSSQPSTQPSAVPSSLPTVQPSAQPTGEPTAQPTQKPSVQPTTQPSVQPSVQPLSAPTSQPSSAPTTQPSSQPTARPTVQPSEQPSAQPSAQPRGEPSSQPSGQPSSRPTGQPSGQPSRQPSTQPSRQPSGQPSTQPSAAPTIYIGEWSSVVTSRVAVDTVNTLQSSVWGCGRDNSTIPHTACTVADARTGEIQALYKFPWDKIIWAGDAPVTGRIVLSGQLSHNANNGNVSSEVADCEVLYGQVTCMVKSFRGLDWRDATYNDKTNRVVLVGRYGTYASISLFDLKNGSVSSYVYRPSTTSSTTTPAVAVASAVLLQTQSVPGFFGSVVSGTCVSSALSPRQPSILSGWVRADTGVMSMMYLYPSTGTVRNSSADMLVTALAVEPTSFDSFIVGGLELDDGLGVHGYMARTSAIYKKVVYGVKYVPHINTSPSGTRRALSTGTSGVRGVVRGVEVLESSVFCVVDTTTVGGRTDLTVLRSDMTTGAITKQASVSATGFSYGSNTSLLCTDITTAGMFLSIACTVQSLNAQSQSLLLTVDTELTFRKLPSGFVRHHNVTYIAESIAFALTSIAAQARPTLVSNASYAFGASSVSPTRAPSRQPTVPPVTSAPSRAPSHRPSSAPSSQPSSSPTAAPTVSARPTSQPSTSGPTNSPKPTYASTERPTARPSSSPPSAAPSVLITVEPTATPTVGPSVGASASPTPRPSVSTTTVPTILFTATPSFSPSVAPSQAPTEMPSEPQVPASVSQSSGRSSTVNEVTWGASAGGAVALLSALAYLMYRRRANSVHASDSLSPKIALGSASYDDTCPPILLDPFGAHAGSADSASVSGMSRVILLRSSVNSAHSLCSSAPSTHHTISTDRTNSTNSTNSTNTVYSTNTVNPVNTEGTVSGDSGKHSAGTAELTAPSTRNLTAHPSFIALQDPLCVVSDFAQLERQDCTVWSKAPSWVSSDVDGQDAYSSSSSSEYSSDESDVDLEAECIGEDEKREENIEERVYTANLPYPHSTSHHTIATVPPPFSSPVDAGSAQGTDSSTTAAGTSKHKRLRKARSRRVAEPPQYDPVTGRRVDNSTSTSTSANNTALYAPRAARNTGKKKREKREKREKRGVDIQLEHAAHTVDADRHATFGSLSIGAHAPVHAPAHAPVSASVATTKAPHDRTARAAASRPARSAERRKGDEVRAVSHTHTPSSTSKSSSNAVSSDGGGHAPGVSGSRRNAHVSANVPIRQATNKPNDSNNHNNRKFATHNTPDPKNIVPVVAALTTAPIENKRPQPLSRLDSIALRYGLYNADQPASPVPLQAQAHSPEAQAQQKQMQQEEQSRALHSPDQGCTSATVKPYVFNNSNAGGNRQHTFQNHARKEEQEREKEQELVPPSTLPQLHLSHSPVRLNSGTGDSAYSSTNSLFREIMDDLNRSTSDSVPSDIESDR